MIFSIFNADNIISNDIICIKKLRISFSLLNHFDIMISGTTCASDMSNDSLLMSDAHVVPLIIISK